MLNPLDGRRRALAFLLAACCCLSIPAQSKRTVAQKKQAARTQFENAERMREALNGKPERQRSRKDYQRAIDAYRKVYYTAPTSNKADASALAVGELMVEYGRAFAEDKSFTDAIGQLEFLRREYPGSRYRVQALFTIAQVYHDDLGDLAKAKETFEEFLKHYPRHELASQAQQALDDMAAEAKAAKSPRKKAEAAALKKRAAKPSKTESNDETPIEAADGNVSEPPPANHGASDDKAELKDAARIVPPESPHKGKLPLVSGIRHWSTPDYTRVAIDLEQEVKYEAGRVPSPDRIFFDLHDTKLASELVGKSFEVGDGFLRKIRVAQYTTTMARVVLEVSDLSEYSAFLLPNPYRLIIDIHGKQQPKTQMAQASPSIKPVDPASAKPSDKSEGAAGTPPVVIPTSPYVGESQKETAKAESKKDLPPVRSKEESPEKDAAKELAEGDTPSTELKKKEVKATTEPTSAPIAENVAPRGKKSRKNSKAEAEPLAREAAPTSSGDRSLIRALGLKIGRIVVDAGHGGHDTGTIGPNGLMEKDLVLDVALKLGKMLEQRLGAEVVYTRDDDTFIPLETRTAIANKHEADLFISVHANSSSDPAARGVETYYLNFTSNRDALEVAARENAVSQKSVFELQDLVKKIALKEKIEESREFAADVQQALHSGLSAKNIGMRDRGVKKAPFVVLIGANMPSILAEISFVSNPGDERKLKTEAYRAKIAESLFKGVAKYASGLSGVKVAANKIASTAAAETTP